MSEPTYRLLRRADLAQLPPMSWAIENVLPAHGTTVLYGPSGSGKTFVALSMALAIATGESWNAHRCYRGPVVYITCEGLSGLNSRICAWEAHTGKNAEDFFLDVNAPNLLERRAVERVTSAIQTVPLQPALIVVDTLAKHMNDGDENSAKDVGSFLRAVDEVRRAFNCAALIVHHTGKPTKSQNPMERGSSALRGGVDTMILAEMDGQKHIRLTCTKQKEAEPFSTVHLRLEQFGIHGKGASCVLVPTVDTPAPGMKECKLTRNRKQILTALMTTNGEGLAPTEIIDASGVAEGSYFREQTALLQMGLIECVGNKMYRLTEAGRERAITIK